MNLRETLSDHLEIARKKAGLRDEIAQYLTGPWLDELTKALEHEAKQWFWWGVGGGLVVGLIVGFAAGWLS